LEIVGTAKSLAVTQSPLTPLELRNAVVNLKFHSISNPFSADNTTVVVTLQNPTAGSGIKTEFGRFPWTMSRVISVNALGFSD